DEYLVIDLGSANGTAVNGQSLSVPARLHNGDVIQIGTFQLAFAVDAPLEPQSRVTVPTDGSATRAVREQRDLPLIGTGPAMAEVFRLIDRAARSTTPVLIEGETGTGKDLVARGIHRASARAGGPFIVASCADLSEGSLGAAGDPTGEGRRGIIEAAAGGTLLLDEIAELVPTVQAKLLRILEAAEIGSGVLDGSPPGAVRILAATTYDSSELVGEKKLRKDLYYRLAGLMIRLPNLRERREDIALLCERFLTAAAARHGKRVNRIEADAMEALVRFNWPGNVRELRNEIERA